MFVFAFFLLVCCCVIKAQDPCDVSQLDDLRADPKSCHSFQECDGKEWVTFDCPLDLYFNPDINQCDYQENVNCTLNHNLEGSNKVKTTHEPCDPEELSRLRPYSNNCSKFQECSAFGWVTFDCPDDLWFDVDINMCNYPQNVRCNVNMTTLKTEGENSCKFEEIDQLRPNVTDCHFFQECNGASWVNIECPPYLLFNQETNQCDYPENVNCTSKLSKIRKDENSCKPEEIDSLRPNATNCHFFQKCNGVNWINLECPLNLWFNPKTNQCDYQENVDCKVNTNKFRADEDSCELEEIDQLRPNATDCHIFQECNGIKWVNIECPLNLLFNPKTKQCDYRSNVECKVQPNKTSGDWLDCTIDHLYPDSANCSRYFICDGTRLISRDCPKGLYFNPEKLYCDWPSNVKCDVPSNLFLKKKIEDEASEKNMVELYKTFILHEINEKNKIN